jgi:hypothetical protein
MKHTTCIGRVQTVAMRGEISTMGRDQRNISAVRKREALVSGTLIQVS